GKVAVEAGEEPEAVLAGERWPGRCGRSRHRDAPRLAPGHAALLVDGHVEAPLDKLVGGTHAGHAATQDRHPHGPETNRGAEQLLRKWPCHGSSYGLPVVLVAFVLVLLAAASFAAGIAASRTSDTLVYISIAFSLGAFVILAVASFRARQAARETPDDRLAAAPRRIVESEAHAGPLLGSLDPTQLDMTPSWRRQARPRTRASEAAVDDDVEAQLEN